MESNSYSYLLPSLGEIFSGTPAGISALMWIFMSILLMVFGNYAFAKYFFAKSVVSVLRDFLEQLSTGKEQAELFLQELKAQSRFRRVSLVLERFYDYIVFKNDANNEHQITSSIAADELVTPHNLIPELVENKFIAYIPSMLTGFGVLGTFIGIQLGVGGINFDTDNIEKIGEGITKLLAGSTVAFMTSIWGILFSLTFGFTEKFLSNSVIADIEKACQEYSDVIKIDLPENDMQVMRTALESIDKCMQELVKQNRALAQNSKNSFDLTPLSDALTTLNNQAKTSSDEHKELLSLLVTEIRVLNDKT